MRISGFQRLRFVNVLRITSNDNLVSIDGLSGIVRVQDLLNIRSNPSLCYILDQTPDTDYWLALVRKNSNRCPCFFFTESNISIASEQHFA